MAKELTKDSIKRLPFPEPPDLQIDFPDGRVPGLSLRLFAGGRRGWYLKYRQDGRQRRYKLGDYPALGIADARKKAERMRVDVRDGADPARDRRERLGATTFGGLVEQYLNEYATKNLAAKTLVERERILLHRDLKPLETLIPSEVTPADIAHALDRIEGRGSHIMLNRYQTALSAVFRWAVQRQRAGLVANPVKQLERRFPETGRNRWLSEDEIRAVWRDIAGRNLGAPTAMKLILVTAQRPGEVARIRWSDIKGSTWSMPQAYRKAVKGQDIALPHDVHLSDLALEIIESLKEHHGRAKTVGRKKYVFPNPQAPDGHIKTKGISHAAQRSNRVLLRAGSVEGRWTPHDLRRTAATHMTKMGADRLVVEKVLGHKDYTVGGIYDRYDRWDKRTAALDAWADSLREIVEADDE